MDVLAFCVCIVYGEHCKMGELLLLLTMEATGPALNINQDTRHHTSPAELPNSWLIPQ